MRMLANPQHSFRNTERKGTSPELAKRKAPPSIFSNDIWLGDNSGASSLFAREVEIRGWTNVGDKLGGAYIGQSNLSYRITFSDTPSPFIVIRCRNADYARSVRMRRPDKGGKRSFFFGSHVTLGVGEV